jgi:hypothetical protein
MRCLVLSTVDRFNFATVNTHDIGVHIFVQIIRARHTNAKGTLLQKRTSRRRLVGYEELNVLQWYTTSLVLFLVNI